MGAGGPGRTGCQRRPISDGAAWIPGPGSGSSLIPVLVFVALASCIHAQGLTFTYPTEPNGGTNGPFRTHQISAFQFLIETTGTDATADVTFVDQNGTELAGIGSPFLGTTVGVSIDTAPANVLMEGVNQILARGTTDLGNEVFSPGQFQNLAPVFLNVDTGPPNNPELTINTAGVLTVLDDFNAEVTFSLSTPPPFTVEVAGVVRNVPTTPNDPLFPISPEAGATVRMDVVPVQFAGDIGLTTSPQFDITRPVTVAFPVIPGTPFPPATQSPGPGGFIFPVVDFSGLADGIYEMRFQARDIVGNLSPITTRSVIRVNVDTIRPAPTITFPATIPLILGPQDRAPPGDQFIFRGVVADERGDSSSATIQVLDTGLTTLFSGTATSATTNGVFSLPLDFSPGGPILPLPAPDQGIFRIDVRAVDAGGNLSTPSAIGYVIRDQVAPVPPVITTPLDGGATASRRFFIRGFVNNILTGREEEEEHGPVRVRIDLVSQVDPAITATLSSPASPTTSTHDSALDNVPGFAIPPDVLGEIPDQFVFDMEFNLAGFPQGLITATAVATDAGGNETGPSQAVTFTLGGAGPEVAINFDRSGPDDNYAFLPLVANRFGADDGDPVNGAPGFFISLKSPEMMDTGDPTASIIPLPPFPVGGSDPGDANQLVLSISATDIATPILSITAFGPNVPPVTATSSVTDTTFTTDLTLDISGLPEGLVEQLVIRSTNRSGDTGPDISLLLFRDVVPAPAPRISFPPLVDIPFGTGTLPSFFTGQDTLALRGTAQPNALIVALVPETPGADALPFPRTTNQSVPSEFSALKPLNFPTDPNQSTRADAQGRWELGQVPLTTLPQSTTVPTPILIQAIDTFDNTDPVVSVVPIGIFRSTVAGDIAEVRLDPSGRNFRIFPDPPVDPVVEQFFARETVDIRVIYNTIITRAPALSVTQFGDITRGTTLIEPADATDIATQVLTFRYRVQNALESFDGPADISTSGGLDAFGFIPNTGAFTSAFFVDTKPPVLTPGGPTSFTPVTGEQVSAVTTLSITATDEPASNGSIEASCISTLFSDIRLFGPLESLTSGEITLRFMPPLPPSQSVTIPCPSITFMLEPTIPVTADGTYEIRARIGDNVGNQARFSSTFILDTVPIDPPMILCIPADRSTVSTLPTLGTSQVVFVSSLDMDLDVITSNIQLLNPSMTSIGQPPQSTGVNTLFVDVVPPLEGGGAADGRYTIVSDLFDRAGNPTQRVTHTFILDTQPPRIVTGFPQPNECVGPPLSSVHVQLEDTPVQNGFPPAPSGIDRRRSRIDLFLVKPALPNETKAGTRVRSVTGYRNSEGTQDLFALEFIDGNGQATRLRDDGSNDGTYKMEVTAVDSAGNTTQATSVFIYDSQPPHVTLNMVNEGAYLADTFVILAGEAFDLGPCGFQEELLAGRFTTDTVQVAIVHLGADGQEVLPIQAPFFDFTNVAEVALKTDPSPHVLDHSNWSFVGQIPNVPGPARLKVRVVDDAGNVNLITRNIVIDTNPLPPPGLLTPVDGSHTPDKVVTFNWTNVIQATTYDLEFTRVTPTNLTTSTTFIGIPWPRHGFGPLDLPEFASSVMDGQPLTVASQFSWRVRSNDLSLNSGAFSTPSTFTVDPTPPGVARIFINGVSAPPTPVVTRGPVTVVIEFVEDTAMDPARGITVLFDPADGLIEPSTLTPVRFDPLRWEGTLTLPPPGVTRDVNGLGRIIVRDGFNLAGTRLEETTFDVIADIGPFFGVRFFANPVIPEELQIVVKAFEHQASTTAVGLTAISGTTFQHGAPGTQVISLAEIPATTTPASAYRSTLRVDTKRIGVVDIRLIGTNVAGRSTDRVVTLTVAQAVGLAGSRFFLVDGKTSLAFPEGDSPGWVLATDGTHLFPEQESRLHQAFASRGLVETSRLGLVIASGSLRNPVNLVSLPAAAMTPAHGAQPPDARSGSREGFVRLDPETGELEWLGRRGDPIKVQELGLFSLVSDPDPPVLILEGVDGLHDENRPTISGTVQDVGSGVSSAAVTATFSGQPGHVTLDSTGRITVTPAQSLSSGTHELQVLVTDRAGNIARSTHSVTIAAPFDVIEAIAVPNPTRGPLARIRYHLTRPASTVRIRFYDSAGRRLQSLDGSSFTGKNDLFWDLTTSRGYQVGPGIVLFRLDASDGSGKTVQRRGKIAIVR